VLTKKGKYGLKAMVYLAQFPPGRLLPILEIASTQQIPKKFLAAILSELRNAGFLNSKKGKGGGYTLARMASQISVGEMIRAIDGPLAPLPCASKTRYQRCDDCLDETKCALRFVMLDAQRALSQVLDGCSLAQMGVMAVAGVEDPNYKI
jgi:Rrf2 family protein